jgi:hypothetical protein
MRTSVGLDGTYLAMGANRAGDMDAGQVEVYHFVNGSWQPMGFTLTTTKASGAHLGSSVNLVGE